MTVQKPEPPTETTINAADRKTYARWQWITGRTAELLRAGHAFDDANWIAQQEASRGSAENAY